MLNVKVYSHHFVVFGYTPVEKKKVLDFATEYGEYSWKRDWRTGRMVKDLKRLYAASNRDRSEVRLHINALNHFKDYMSKAGFPFEGMAVEYVPMYEPAVCKLVDTKAKTPRDEQLPQIDHLAAVDGCPSRVVELQTGKGKAQPLNALIRIPYGWKKMGDIAVGDKIIAKDGTVTEVLGVYPQGIKMVYKVIFGDGRTVECCGEHLWKVYRPNRAWESKVVDTYELDRLKRLSNNRLHIDLIDPEQTADIALPIDPYVLGVLIGDGCLSERGIRFSTADDFIIDSVKNMLPPKMEVRFRGRYDYSVISTGMQENPWLTSLRELGLAGKKSYQKFVPETYLEASSRQRLAILQGLMDTDGTAGKEGRTSFATTSERLAKDVQYLARSLGCMAIITPKRTSFTHRGVKKLGRLSYTVGIRSKVPSSLFRLERKKRLAKDSNQYSNGLKLSVEAVKPVGMKPVQCISVSHPEQLYVTNDFTVTHNTATFLFAALRRQTRVVCCIRPQYIKRWLDDLVGKERIIDYKKKDILVIRGSEDLKNLIALARDNELNAKFIIISNKTLQLYLTQHEMLNGVHDYGCAPEELFGLLKVGIRLVDECHQDFHLNFKLDLYTHCPVTIDLSATLVSDNKTVTKMYGVKFPPASRVNAGAYDRYIAVSALFYGIRHPEKVRFTRRGLGSYSHVDFEHSILRSKEMTKNYMRLIKESLDSFYIEVREPGQRALVFASTVEMCTLIAKEMQYIYKDLDVYKYTGGDDYERLKNCDIGVSTLGSAGTAVDIPGLRVVVCTTAIDSIQANIQAMGRLRRLRDWPDVTPNFLYFTCIDVPPHMLYHENKMEKLKGRALSHNILYLNNNL